MLTYRDCIEHLIDVCNLDGKDVADVSRKLRRAVREACNKLPAMYNWEFLRLTGMFTTSIPYTKGTIQYVLSTRLLTLTGGTWPTDAQFGDIVIDNRRYLVQRRVSDTVLFLDEYESPKADAAAGTSYTWARSRYLLPYFVSDLVELVDTAVQNKIKRIFVEESFWISEWFVTGMPSSWSLIPSRHRPGRWEVWLSSSPYDVRQYRYMYENRWASNEVEELNSGTVAVASDVATFSSAILTPACVGAVLRVSSSTTQPTSVFGKYDATTKVMVLNPPASEHIITTVVSTTSALLNEAVTTNVTGKAFTISSQVALNTEGMLEFFYRLCEYQYSIISRADANEVLRIRELMLDAFKIATGADSRRLESHRTPFSNYTRPFVIE